MGCSPDVSPNLLNRKGTNYLDEPILMIEYPRTVDMRQRQFGGPFCAITLDLLSERLKAAPKFD
jgi:hypothetical protein